MHQLEPFFREAGAGPGVVCTHANASSSGQWRHAEPVNQLIRQFFEWA